LPDRNADLPNGKIVSFDGVADHVSVVKSAHDIIVLVSKNQLTVFSLDRGRFNSVGRALGPERDNIHFIFHVFHYRTFVFRVEGR
jgi:hypothetical protein